MIAAARNYEGFETPAQVWRVGVMAEPSQSEIEAQCEAFQRTWTERERRRRLAGLKQPIQSWTVPEVSTTDLDFRPEDLVGRDS